MWTIIKNVERKGETVVFKTEDEKVSVFLLIPKFNKYLSVFVIIKSESII